ncbi:MAG: tetratricopeptide repeat protein [Pseudomonadota bacterium]
MLKIKGVAKYIHFSNKQRLTVFSPKIASHDIKLIFPLYSRVISECGVILHTNTKSKSLPTLTNSFISFYGGPDNYQLLEKTAQLGDQGIAALANIAASVHMTMFKLFSLKCLKLAMEAFSKSFSLQEYYALSEFTAIALLEANHADQAIHIIQHIPYAALKFYNFSFRSMDPIYRSTRELLSLAYLLQGNYSQAEKEANQLISTLQKKPFASYLARAYTAEALACYFQGRLQDSIHVQEKAVKLLQSSHDKALYATALFNLHALYHAAEKQEQADIIMQDLNSIVEKIHDPRLQKLKSFLRKEINTTKNTFPSLYRP